MNTYTISKEHAFSASHRLLDLPQGHPCGRLHGHNYVLRITLTGTKLNTYGFLFDYGDLKPFTRWVDETLDHQHLNNVTPMQPSAENLSRWLAQRATQLLQLPAGVTISVAVSETPKTWATWTP